MKLVRKSLSILIVICLCVSMFSTVAFAAPNDQIPAKPKITVTSVNAGDRATNVPLYEINGDGGFDETNEKVNRISAEFVFKVSEDNSAETLEYYKDWRCDFIVTFTGDVPAYTFGMYGKYGNYGEIAFVVPFDIHDGDTFYLLEAMGIDDQMTFGEVVDNIGTFTCGAFNLNSVNSGKNMKVDLVIWEDGTEPADGESLGGNKYGFNYTTAITRPALPTANIEMIKQAFRQTDVPVFTIDENGDLAPTYEKVAKLGAEYVFTAVEPSQETMDCYRDWRCDYIVTFDEDIPAGTFGLYGKYGDYDLAFVFPEDIHAGDSINLVESLGLGSWTYGEIYEQVRTFTCGAFNLSEDNLNEKKMTVNLAIWQDGAQEYTTQKVSSTDYKFNNITELILPDLPTATVTELDADDFTDIPLFAFDDQGEPQPTYTTVSKLGSAYTFVADDVSDETYIYYKDWRCDFVVSFDKDIPAGTFGLYGKYGNYDIAFVYPEDIHAGDTINLVESAGLGKQTYEFIKDSVGTFTCGAFNLDESNSDATMTVDLAIWKDGEQDETTKVVETEDYGFDDIAEIQVPDQPNVTIASLSGNQKASNVPLYEFNEENELVSTLEKVKNIGVEYVYKIGENSDDTLNYYRDWRCDYVVTFNKDIPAGTFGLYGAYGDYEMAFVIPVDIHAGDSINLLEAVGLDNNLTFGEVTAIDTFTCGAFNLSQDNKDDPDLRMRVSLNIWKDGDPSSKLQLGMRSYTFADLTEIVGPKKPNVTITSVQSGERATNVSVYAINEAGEIEPTNEKVNKIGAQFVFSMGENSEETLEYYNNWRCDYVITFNEDIPAGSFGLYGQYGDYDDIAFVIPFDIQAGDTINLLEAVGLDDHMTFGEVNAIGTFTCGAFNLAYDNMNVGKEMKVDLVIWRDGTEPADGLSLNNRKYTFNNISSITGPDYPTATVTTLGQAARATNVPLFSLDEHGDLTPTYETVEKLGAEYIFTADEPSEETWNYYKDWRCDYVVTFEEDIPAGTFGLYGKYGDYDLAFVFPEDITAGQSINLVESLGLGSWTYGQIYEQVSPFTCGAFNLSEENTDKKMKVNLTIWKDDEHVVSKRTIAYKAYTFQDVTTIVPPTAPVAVVTQADPENNVPVFVMTDVTDPDSITSIAAVTTIENVYTFSLDPEESVETSEYYKDWLCDFKVTFNEDIPANTFGLYGSYGDYNIAFVYPEDIRAGDSLYLLDMLQLGDWSYEDIKTLVQEFKCGAFNLSEDNMNVGKEMEVALVMWAPDAAPEGEGTVKAAEETYLFDDLTDIKVTIAASAKDAEGNDVAATVTGGGDYTVGTEVTLTANAAQGYEFIGWYLNEEQVSTDMAYTLTAMVDAEYTAIYAPSGNGKLTVTASGFSISFDGGAAAPGIGTQNYNKAIGTRVELTYTGDDFLYWVNSSNNIVSREAAYSFVLVGATSLQAVSTGDVQAEPSAYVVFHNAYNQVVKEGRVDAYEVEELFPNVNPGKMGGVFSRWIIEDTGEEVSVDNYDAIIAKMSATDNVIIHIVPEYEDIDGTYTVIIQVKDGDTIIEVKTLQKAIGEKLVIDKNAVAAWAGGDYEEADISFFSLDGGETASSYGDEFTVISAVDGTEITVTAVVDPEIEPVPVIAITEMFATENGDGSYLVSPTMKYYVPDGYTVRESGFVYSRTTAEPEKLVVENVGNDNVKKHLTGVVDSSLIYTMNIKTSYADRTFNVVAFLIYEDANHNILTIYSPVSSGSYSSLS